MAFLKWCLHRELNTGFILTMDAYYHYTMKAYINFTIRSNVYILRYFFSL